MNAFLGDSKALGGLSLKKWVLDEVFFDIFFDVACALTNVDILLRPLCEEDGAYNTGVYNMILLELETKAQRQRRANEDYIRRRRQGLRFDSSDSNTEDFDRPDFMLN